MRLLLASLLAATLLGGCAVYTPSGAVVIDPHGSHDHGGGGGGGSFCPPGQAKKGRC